MKTKFKNLLKILDKEIESYEQLKVLFEEKKALLIKAKSDDLGVLDNKILSLNDTIVKLNNSRKTAGAELISDEAVMSDFIELAETTAPEFKEPLLLRKDKICKLSNELVLLNNQNMELIKHGIIITNKMLETIVDVFAPQGSIYNGAGKTDTRDYDMWTVNEEI